MMDRRTFLMGASTLALSACSRRTAPDLDLAEPIQIDRTSWEVAPGMMGLASFSGTVLVLSRHDYPENPADTLSAVSPTDLAVAWGLAAKDETREAIELTQSERRYTWRARQSAMGIPGVRRFTQFSGNWHMIPASPEVAAELRRIAAGDVIRFEGDLVQVSFTNGIYYRSSTTRDDLGDGACEIIRLREIRKV